MAATPPLVYTNILHEFFFTPFHIKWPLFAVHPPSIVLVAALRNKYPEIEFMI